MDTIDQDILNAFVTKIKEAAAEAAVNTVTQNTKTYISPMSTDKINRIAVAAGDSAAKAAENVINEHSKDDDFQHFFSDKILEKIKTGVLIGAFEGTQAGVKAGNEAGERVGAEAGENEGKKKGKNGGAIAGAKAGEKAGAIAGAEAGAIAGVEAGIEVAMPKSTQIQNDVSLIAKERGEQAGIQAGILAGAITGARAGATSKNTIRIMGMFFSPKKRLFCSIKVCKEPVNDDGFAYNIGEALKTQTIHQHYLKSLSVVKNEDIQVQNITSTNIVKELEKYKKYRGVSLNSQFAGYMRLSYLIDQVETPENNVVVLWTKKVTRKGSEFFYGNEIEIEAIFTYTTLDDDGNKLQYKRVKRNGSVEIKSLIYIQAFTVNNLIEQHFRCVSGSNVFNWFYYTAKTVGLKCVKLRAIGDAMKFWIKVKFDFNLDTNDSIVLEPTSNGKKSKKNKEQKNRTKKIKQKIKKYEKQLLLGNKSIQLRQEINNLKLEENSAEMLRENTSADKSTSLEVVMNSVEIFGELFDK